MNAISLKAPARFAFFSSAFSLCCVIALFPGCAMPPRNAVTIEVPFISQEQTNHCGVAALAMALEFHRVPYDRAELAAAAYLPALRGSPLQLLAAAATDLGLQTALVNATVADLSHALERDCVPIIYLGPRDDGSVGHFVVVTGVSRDGRTLRIHDPLRGTRWTGSRRLLKRGLHSCFPAVLVGNHRGAKKTGYR